MGEGNDEGPSRRHGRTRLRLQIVVSWCGLLFWVLVLGSCCLGRLISCVVLVWGFFGYVFRFVIGSCYRLRVFSGPRVFVVGYGFGVCVRCSALGFCFRGLFVQARGLNFGPMLAQFWTNCGPVWGQFGIDLGPIGGQFGAKLGGC